MLNTLTTHHSIAQAEAAVRARGGALTFIVWTGHAYEERTIRLGFGGCLIGRRADVDTAVEKHKAAGYTFGMVVYLDHLTTLDALEGAIEMLRKIKDGGTYTANEYFDRLWSYEKAASDQRKAEQLDAAARAHIRNLAEQRRAS